MKTLYEIKTTDNLAERESDSIDLFNHAMKQGDEATVRAVAEYVVGEGELRNKAFSRNWQFHCLGWLTHYWRNAWAESADGSTEESETLERLMLCLWQHKWLVGSLPQDLGAGKAAIADALENMRTLYATFKLSPAMVYKAAVEQAIYMGDAEAAKQAFAQWQAAEQDGMNDCKACEQSSLIHYWHFIGDYARAAELAAPVLAGQMSCAEVPHIAYFPAIDSLIMLGRAAEAEAAWEEAAGHIGSAGSQYLYLMPCIVQLAHRLGQPEKAQSLLEMHGRKIENAVRNNSYDALQYLIATAPMDLRAKEMAEKLAREFDRRNGNPYYQRQLAMMFSPTVIH